MNQYDQEQELFDRITLELNGINPEVYVPMQTIDHNWQALKNQSMEPFVPEAKIQRVSNVVLTLFANSQYQKGNFYCDVYKEDHKQAYEKNLIFEVTPELTPRQYNVWDLLMTDAHLSGCRARRCKFYNKNDANDYAADFAHFEIWKNNELIWACLLVEDWIIPMNTTLDTYQQSGNLRMTAPWKNRQLIDEWYKENI